MGAEWCQCRWGDVATLEYGRGLRGYNSATGPYRVFGTNGPIGWHSDPLCEHPTIIIGRKGAYRGVHYSPKPCFVIDTAFYLKPIINFDMRWAYYHLLTHDINSMDSGSAIPSTSRDSFYNLPVPFPPLPEQRAIAHILGTLDEKIELNRQMNKTLEEIAQALFKSWFIDFDPVHAKAEGRDTGLPKEIADLFPDSFENSEMGQIPKEWKALSFTDTIEISGGGTPKTSVTEYWGGDIPWYTVRDSPRENDVFVIDTAKTITEAGVKNSSTRILPVGATIISARGTVGKLALTGVPMAMNQTCYGFKGKISNSDFFTFFLTRNLVSTLQRRTHGSVFDTITRDTLATVKIVLPSSELVNRFETEAAPIMGHGFNNLWQNKTITTIRDALLPKLISGMIRVKDYEKLLEGVL